MSKPVYGLILGAVLGAIDGLTAWFTPEVRNELMGIVMGSTMKGLVAGILIGIFSGIGFIFCIIPGLVLAAAYSFTYLLIINKKMDFWPAMQASMDIVKQDWVGFVIFLFAMAIVNVIGVMACFVGVLVTMPITFAAVTVAYKEIVGFDRLPEM